MAEIDLQQRKTGCGGANPVASLDPESHRSPSEDKDHSQRASLWQFKNFWQRRQCDILSLLAFLLDLVILHVVTTRVLLNDAVAARLYPLAVTGIVLVVTSWLGVIYHGPGHPPSSGTVPASQRLPPAITKAFEIGKYAIRYPFSNEDGWCTKCDRWKPLFVHHCARCGVCTIMDHHCYYAAQCVGFRNMRCFFVWLFYCLAGLGCLGVVTLWHLWVIQPNNLFDCGKWFAWMFFLYRNAKFAYGYFTTAVRRIDRGWISAVQYLKFTSALEDVRQEILSQEDTLEHDASFFLVSQSFTAALNSLISDDSSYLLGLHVNPRPLVGMTHVFGSPPSWRWLLPFVAGGTGDPLQTMLYNEDICQAYSTICNSMEMVEGMKAEAARKQQAAVDAQGAMLQKWLDQAKSTG